MPLPLLSGRQIVSALETDGFSQVKQRGSHLKLKNESGRVVIVPMHREVKRGTLKSILRQAGITEEEFRKLI